MHRHALITPGDTVKHVPRRNASFPPLLMYHAQTAFSGLHEIMAMNRTFNVYVQYIETREPAHI